MLQNDTTLHFYHMEEPCLTHYGGLSQTVGGKSKKCETLSYEFTMERYFDSLFFKNTEIPVFTWTTMYLLLERNGFELIYVSLLFLFHFIQSQTFYTVSDLIFISIFV